VTENRVRLRKTGLKIIGHVPWGSHFCLLYKSQKDLIDILVPYFKAGLENNELCIWVTAAPLEVEDAKAALHKAVNNLPGYIEAGQIEIIDSIDWYVGAGNFNLNTVLQKWSKKEQFALKKGFDGIRVSGNLRWLQDKDWKKFTEYEEIINDRIKKHRMIAICAYYFNKMTLSKQIAMGTHHQSTIVRRKKSWNNIESRNYRQIKENLYAGLEHISPSSK
jgi:hypothetical protein